ncbi:hypothetical protein BHM03_00031863 [Ensete ventricosum]|nr:hypothetical protein BHM03_00031863 [Ensete ventricosum]
MSWSYVGHVVATVPNKSQIACRRGRYMLVGCCVYPGTPPSAVGPLEDTLRSGRAEDAGSTWLSCDVAEMGTLCSSPRRTDHYWPHTELTMAERCASGMTELMMAERHVSGTIELTMAERHVSGTTELMMAERRVSGTIELTMAERRVLGMTELMMAERCVSSTIKLTMAERCASGTTELMMAERHVSGTIELTMTKRRVSGTIDLTMAERLISGTIELAMAERCVSSTIVLMMAERHVSGTIELTMLKDPHFSPLRATPVVLAADGHGRFRADMVEGNPSPFLGNPGYDREVIGRGLSPASRGAMDLNVLRKKPRMSGGKSAPAAGPEGTRLEVEVTHTEASAKRPAGSSIPDQTVAGRLEKRVKIAVRKHKSHHGEGSSRRAAREREPDVSAEDSSPTYHQPKSMRDLCSMRVQEDDEGYYVLQMADWAPRDSSAAMRARWPNLSYQTQVWDDPEVASEFDRGVLHLTLAKDLYTLPSEVLIARAAKQIVLADNAKLKSGLDELSSWLDEADKELNKLREGLAESQRQLKEQKVDHRKADDELLKLMRENESLKAELPGKSVANYRQSLGLGWGL